MSEFEEFCVVRRSDGARIMNLYLCQKGLGTTPFEASSNGNPDLAEDLRRWLDLEKCGGVSFGKEIDERWIRINK